MTSSGQSTWNRDDTLYEGVIYEKSLADDIGPQWKDLARALGFYQASIEAIQEEKGNFKECCIEVLVRWLRQNGKGATVGKLVDALTKIGLKNVADKFPINPSDTSQNDKMEETIRDICEQLTSFSKEVCKMRNRIKELEEEKVFKIKELEKEVSKLKTKNNELEEEVSRLRAINKELQDGEKQEVEVFKIKELEEEVSRLRAINKELQDGEKQEVEVSRLRAKTTELQDSEKQEIEDLEDKHFFDMSPWAVSGETEEEVREHRISAKLQTYKHQLATYVTSPLEVPEVKQDHLKTAVKLDILKTLSEHLEVLYIGTREMVSETCKCSEDLKREFYDFAYHGLRVDHDELVHTVKDLEDTVQEMSEEEKEELQKLKEFQMNRQSLIKALEEKWRVLFSPPERLPKNRWSADITGTGKRSTDNKKPERLPKNRWSADITGRGERSTDNKKVKRNTDHGARPKQRNVSDKRFQNPKPLSQTRKKLKRLRLGTFDSQRLKES